MFGWGPEGIPWPGIIVAGGTAVALALLAVALRPDRPRPWVRPEVARTAGPTDLVSLALEGAARDRWAPFLDRARRRTNGAVVVLTGRPWNRLPGLWDRWRGRVPDRVWNLRTLRRRATALRLAAGWDASAYTPRLTVWRSPAGAQTAFRARVDRWVGDWTSATESRNRK